MRTLSNQSRQERLPPPSATTSEGFFAGLSTCGAFVSPSSHNSLPPLLRTRVHTYKYTRKHLPSPIGCRISITKYFMSEHEHYDRRKKKMASLLKAYVESGDPQLGEKLSSILETARQKPFCPCPLHSIFLAFLSHASLTAARTLSRRPVLKHC